MSPTASYKMRMEAHMKAMVYDDALDAANAGQCLFNIVLLCLSAPLVSDILHIWLSEPNVAWFAEYAVCQARHRRNTSSTGCMMHGCM